MATFQYIARTMSGERVEGVVTADNESAALRHLDERQLLPVQVKPTVEAKPAFSRRIRSRAVGAMYEQLADLLGAGVPMMRALDTLDRVCANAELRKLVAEVRNDVAEGSTLADAMAAHPQAFTPLHTAMLRAGERGGFVEEVLANLSKFIERQDDLRSKVMGAMIYPGLLASVGGSVMLASLLVFVPMFEPFFGSMELPPPTALLFAVSGLLRESFVLVLTLAIFVVSMAVAFLRGERGARVREAIVMRTPLVGNATRMVAVTRFCRILGTMLTNGVPLLPALQIARDAVGLNALAVAIDGAIENVRAGQGLTEPLRQARMIPVEILEMISVAEESNQLERVLLNVADNVEKRTNRQIDQAVSLIGPVILVLMAIVVGFMAIGLLYPIFTMSEAMTG